MKAETQKLKQKFYKQLVRQGANYQFAAIAAEALAKEQLEGYQRNSQDQRAINECHKKIARRVQ
ncbi:hypothetical protein H6F78_17035 [Coleofasciculus sp. FACHB-64]|uniref:hypothetical protein n=1 Tax=Cyanophyceae TaxID=3028117 RepID=UPI001682477F|nr:hypothetical protein [Coleofasciculus sp. FACHB-64]MBD2047276.1 hypothetical protein [Coleofasciculus sp. FACHB-64]